MTVALWTPGGPLPTAKTVLYKRDDEAAFDAQVRKNVSGGTIVYKILPNGYPFLDLLRLYLHHRDDPTDAWLDAPTSIPVDHVWLARDFVRLRTALKSWDDRGASSALVSLEKRAVLLHPDQVRFVGFCKSFVGRVMQPFLWGSPHYLATATTPRAKAWWSLPSDLSAEVDAQISDLRTRFSSQLPPALQNSFYQWLIGLKGWLSTQLFVPAQADALREASALCHGLAHIHFSLGRPSIALLYCHRATDLLLFSECAAVNLVDFTANNGGGELKHSDPDRRKISILNCYNSLVANRVMLSNSAREAVFTELNAYRNLLLLTHFLGSVTSSTAQRLLTDASRELRSIGGTGWEASSKAVRRVVELNAHDFFDLSAGLMGTLVPA